MKTECSICVDIIIAVLCPHCKLCDELYREKNKERVRAQKNASRGVMPGVFIMECF